VEMHSPHTYLASVKLDTESHFDET